MRRLDVCPSALIAVDLYGQCCDYARDRGRVRAPRRAARSRTRPRRLGASYEARPAGALRPVRRLLVQRQQDHHHQRRRHARLARRDARRPGAPPRHAGARPGSALRALGHRVQLPPEQPPRGARRGPAADARRPRSHAAARSALQYRRACLRSGASVSARGRLRPFEQLAHLHDRRPSICSAHPPEQIRFTWRRETSSRVRSGNRCTFNRYSATARVRGGAVAARLFATGLCLPSGSSLQPQQQRAGDRSHWQRSARPCRRHTRESDARV